MRKVKITLPASITQIGPAIGSLGLAVALHTIVEITERDDDALQVDTTGEGAGRYPIGLQHPVVLGLIRLFQHLERAVTGMTIRVENRIPYGVGLGGETAATVAGIIGGNNLLGNPLPREGLLALAAATRQPEQTVTSILGGLSASVLEGQTLIYRSLNVTGQRVIIAVPEFDSYETPRPERVPHADALHNLSRVPLVVEALSTGDHPLLAQVMEDRLFVPLRKSALSGYESVVRTVRQHGASAVTTSGDGPALVVFTPDNHRRIAVAIEDTFRDQRIPVRTWILPIDTQGVVVSAMQSG